MRNFATVEIDFRRQARAWPGLARASIKLRESFSQGDGLPGQAHGCLARSVLITPPCPWRHPHEYSCAVAPHGLRVVRSQIRTVVAWEGALPSETPRSRADASGLFAGALRRRAGWSRSCWRREPAAAAGRRS